MSKWVEKQIIGVSKVVMLSGGITVFHQKRVKKSKKDLFITFLVLCLLSQN